LALKRAYQGASTRRELSGDLDQLQLRTGFTRVVILARAATLGFGARRRRWTAEEIEVLTNAAGRLSDIARRLNRSYGSVKGEFSRLELRSRVMDGYSQTDVAYLLGASPRSVRKWLSLGWLKLQHSRITEASLIRFIRTQPEEYQLSRVDEAWFKGVLFSAFGRKYTNGLGGRSALAN
jgi:DNA-binding CsgD family transcriptional regulator